MSVQSYLFNAYAEEHLKLLEGVALQAVIAIENARLFDTLQKELVERDRAENEVRLLNIELEARVARRTAELQVANKELEAFSYSVSHDLRAPLRSIDGFSRVLLEDYGPNLAPDAQQHLNRVRASAQRMDQLIEDLLAFSRLGRRPVNTQTVDPAALAREAWEELQPAAGGRLVEFSLGSLPACRADPVLMRQVWANLLDNALKYSRGRSPARIEVGWRDGAYFVRDNGVGFDMQFAGKLFGVFQRLHHASEFEGSGVGLANVKRIVERLGGRVWAEARLDEGAVFFFSLPPAGQLPEMQP